VGKPLTFVNVRLPFPRFVYCKGTKGASETKDQAVTVPLSGAVPGNSVTSAPPVGVSTVSESPPPRPSITTDSVVVKLTTGEPATVTLPASAAVGA